MNYSYILYLYYYYYITIVIVESKKKVEKKRAHTIMDGALEDTTERGIEERQL
jgi:hypothetical protein